MAVTGNKGEWSELYTFFKLLADGKLYSGDGDLNRYDEKWFPILEIFRDDSSNRNTYQVNSAKNNILIVGKTIELEISQNRFREEALRLLDFIMTHRTTKGIPNEPTESFMREIDCGKIKAESSDKADIRIVIHNLVTGTKSELGYSIKSKLGGDSSLINSSGNNTNFIYRINGIKEDDIPLFNSLDRFRKKFKFLDDIGATVSFVKVAENGLHNNLIMLDLGMERIIAECLLHYYRGDIRNLDDAVHLLENEDPLEIAINVKQPMYEYKVKQFLLAFALGMTASTPWQGKFNANGGYIVVKEDGDIVCYHFFDRNDLENYLFMNTRFDTPSISRHQYGEIYEEDGEYYLKLNLQVRFKN